MPGGRAGEGEAGYAVFQHLAVEFLQQGEAAAAELQVGAGLRFVQREDVLDGFEFEQNGGLDDDVGQVALVETDAVEEERQGVFARWMKT
nr:hypothetical protein [uncultured Rhodopila sp.]